MFVQALAVALSAAALAACVVQTTPQSTTPASTAPAQPQVDTRRDAPAVAETACLTAVRNQTNNPEVMVLSSEFSQANSVVMVGVGPDRAPWRCLVSNDGQVAEVMFAGSEGAL